MAHEIRHDTVDGLADLLLCNCIDLLCLILEPISQFPLPIFDVAASRNWLEIGAGGSNLQNSPNQLYYKASIII